MKGIIIVNKEKGCTSRDVVNSLCKIFNTKKIGHTGTLDPMAEGVLIICIGRYTKLVDLITAKDKEYIAKVKIGILTDTLDNTGSIINVDDTKISIEKLKQVINDFPKSYMQEVPAYSAVKINGKKLYEYARNNESCDLPKRLVNIHSLELLSATSDEFTFKTNVSKGTYIRSLIKDICYNCDLIGVMSELTRTKQGDILLENAYKLTDIVSGNYKMLNARDVLFYDEINLTDSEKFLVVNGVKINKDVKDGNYFMMYNGEEIAIYNFFEKTGKMKVFLKDE